MKISWRYLSLFLVFVVLIILIGLNPSLLTTYLLEPIARIIWLFIRTFLAINQLVYWAFLIIAGLMLVLKLIPGHQDHPIRNTYLDCSWSEDRVTYWEALLQSAEDDPKARKTLQQALETLYRSVQGLVERTTDKDIRLPAVKKRYQLIRPAYKSLAQLFKLSHPEIKDLDFERNVDQLLTSMENQLERNHNAVTSHSNDD